MDPYFIPYTKINSKWIKDINKQPETIKLLEEKRERKLYNVNFGNDFLDMTPKARTTPEKDKLTASKLKASAPTRYSLPTEYLGENICKLYI